MTSFGARFWLWIGGSRDSEPFATFVGCWGWEAGEGLNLEATLLFSS